MRFGRTKCRIVKQRLIYADELQAYLFAISLNEPTENIPRVGGNPAVQHLQFDLSRRLQVAECARNRAVKAGKVAFIAS